MASKPALVLAHSDKTLLAEVSFWAASADIVLVQPSRGELRQACRDRDSLATIIELTTQDEEILDTIEYLGRHASGKVIAVCSLDAKTISSMRRLFEAKSIDVMVLARSAFSTHLLADLLKARASTAAPLDRESLARAMKDGYLIAHYQPKVPFLPGSEKYGVEALCRIQHPQLGLLLPDSFIPLAEANDLILELTDIVTVQAFRAMKSWDDAGTQLRLALNISPRLMSDTTWFELFQRRCQEFSVDPSRITLEVTESSSQGGKILALEILSRLRLKGFLLSIDDYGTGFSSLETLYKLPFGELKIDKGFVLDIQKNPEARALVESTVQLAHRLGLKVCAEGVESEEIFRELQALKCDDAQGYYVGKAIAADDVVAFFQAWSAKGGVSPQQAQSSKFAAVHALLADILNGPQDDQDETIVLAAGPAPQDGPRDIAARIPALMLGGAVLSALEHVHRAIAGASGEQDGDLRSKLEKLRGELEQGLACRSINLHFPTGTAHLVGGPSVLIGRESPTTKADIAIPCRWLSRGEKNLRLFKEAGIWLIEDLGSTNGHFIDGRRLVPFQPHKLADQNTLVEIGKPSTGPAPAWLAFHPRNGGAMELRFGFNSMEETSLLDHDESWILVDGEISAGCSNDAVLMLPECGKDFIADISFRDNGFWIAPRPGEKVTLDEIEFLQAVPLPAKAVLTLGAARLSSDPMAPGDAASDHSTASAVA